MWLWETSATPVFLSSHADVTRDLKGAPSARRFRDFCPVLHAR